MCLVAVQSRHFVEFAQFSVDAYLRVSSLAHLLEKLLIMALAALDDRSKQIAFASGIILHYERHDLLVRIPYHRPAGLGRIRS